MDTNSGPNQNDELYSEADDHAYVEKRSSIDPATLEKFKQVGQKGLSPLLSVFEKYRGDFQPFFNSLQTSLRAAVASLDKEDATSADKFLRQWLSETINWLDTMKTKFEGKDTKEFMAYFEEEAKNHPGAMFAISYVAGLVLGRLGRHLVMKKSATIH